MKAEKLLSAALIFVVLYSCSTYSLKKDMLQPNALNELTYPKVKANQTVYFKKTLIYTDDNKLFIKRHRILKLGSNLKSAPEILYTYDYSLEKLLNCEARVLRHNEKVAYYKLKDFHTMSLSNARMISDAKVRILPVTDVLNTGDVVEIISQHEQTFPELGNILTPAEAGTNVYNAEFVVEYPVSDTIYYKTVNTQLKPDYHHNETSSQMIFKLNTYLEPLDKNYFDYKNKEAAIYVNKKINPVSDQIPNWNEFGNWYLNLINERLHATPEICQLAEDLTKNLSSDKIKMDSIFQYIQKNVRYEQEYLEYGGIIPNPPATILSRKYGDCKDYSLLMYLMAKCVGLNPDLTLCYRGRGIEFYDELPVSQFNHMILHLNSDSSDFWYDGTNRTGISGITTADLINQKGLVIKKDHTQLINIDESDKNQLAVTGSLWQNSKSLNADLQIVLSSQYAIKFFYLSDYLNTADFYNYMINWIHNNLGSNLNVEDLSWQKGSKNFTIYLETEIPNSIVEIDDYSYLSLKKIFNHLIPEKIINPEAEPSINYYPDYGRILIDLKFPEYVASDSVQGVDAFHLEFKSQLPPGPFDTETRKLFIRQYREILEEYAQIYKLNVRG